MSLITKTILAAFAAAAAYLFGDFDLPFQTLLFVLIVDYALGTYAAAKMKELQSRKAWLGIGKKIVTLLVVALAVRFDIMMNLGGALRLIAIYGYLGSELYSIIENLGKAGVKIPAKLAQFFKDLTEKFDKGPEK